MVSRRAAADAQTLTSRRCLCDRVAPGLLKRIQQLQPKTAPATAAAAASASAGPGIASAPSELLKDAEVREDANMGDDEMAVLAGIAGGGRGRGGHFTNQSWSATGGGGSVPGISSLGGSAGGGGRGGADAQRGGRGGGGGFGGGRGRGGGFGRGRGATGPDDVPGPGYICYRCHKGGHFIYNCPTNNDPDFKPVTHKPTKVTGIPK